MAQERRDDDGWALPGVPRVPQPRGGSDSALATALDQVSAGLDALGGVRASSLGDADLAPALQQLSAVVARVHAVAASLLEEADTRDLPRREGAASTSAWLGGLTRMNRSAAARFTAASLRLPGCPSAARALASGAVDVEQAGAVALAVEKVAALASTPVAAAQGRSLPAETEAYLLGVAAEHDARTVTQLGEQVLHYLDPDGGDALSRNEEWHLARRALAVTTDATGFVVFRGVLEPEAGAAFTVAIGALSSPRPSGPDGPDPRTPARRRADALAELSRRALAAGDLPRTGGQRPQVVVTVPLASLRAGTGGDRHVWSALLEDGTPVSASAARRTACDAALVPMVLGSRSEPLDVGRASRLVTDPQRRALVERDRGCAMPGCDRPAPWCEAHHVVHWADGGDTSLANLVLLCGHHHRVVHHQAWEVRPGADARPEFLPPPWLDPDRVPRRRPRPDLDLRRPHEAAQVA